MTEVNVFCGYDAVSSLLSTVDDTAWVKVKPVNMGVTFYRNECAFYFQYLLNTCG